MSITSRFTIVSCEDDHRPRSTGLIGVSRDREKYSARIMRLGKSKYLGSFTDRGEAAIAYDKAVLRIDPEFWVINYPMLRNIYLAEIAAEGAA